MGETTIKRVHRIARFDRYSTSSSGLKPSCPAEKIRSHYLPEIGSFGRYLAHANEPLAGNIVTWCGLRHTDIVCGSWGKIVGN